MSTPRAPPAASKLVRTTSRSSNAIPAVGETVPVAGEPRPGDEQRPRPGQERDPAMAQRDKGGDHRRDPGRVVDADLGLAQRVRREVDDRRAVGAHRGQVAVDLLGDRRVVEAAAGEDDGRRPDRAQQPDVRPLALGVPFGEQVMTRKPATEAASSTPRTTSAKYGSVMSWTMTATTGTRLLSSPRARAFGT